MPLHRFCVHTLTTVYRTIDAELQTTSHDQSSAANSMNRENPLMTALNKELSKMNQEADAQNTTVPPIVTGNTLPSTSGLGNLMSLSQSWLLAASLPNVFTRINDRKSMTFAQSQANDKQETSDGTTVSIPTAIEFPMSHLLSTIPMHWSLLYDSQQHGVGANRFLHHVIGYKGPTLILLHPRNVLVMIFS